MDLPPSNWSRGEVAGADPAFMLFGKQIKGPLPTNEIKEELSPRGVDERGVSLATSSDEEEDLNASVEATCEEMQWRKRKGTEDDCLVQAGKQGLEKQQNINEGDKCLGGGIEMEKHTNTERELKWERDMQARKRQVGLWSRCPRCNSTDTKFCYFNNYNVNQPRHFCKHCQRYWTAGGTLRNVPVGAGKRKSKHALRKEAFFMSPVCAANSTASMDAPAEGTEANQEIRSGSAKVNVDVLADTGGIRDADYRTPICIPSEPCPMVRMPPVNTDLELCHAHQISTSLPMKTTCTQSQCTSLNALSPDMVTPLQQLHMRSSPLSSGSAKCSSELAKVSDDSDRYVPGRGCSKFSEISPNLADGRASGSAGLSQISAEWQNGSSGLSQISADWQSGSSGLSQISVYLSGLSHPSAYLQSGTSHELRSSPNWEGGLAKRDPDLANGFQPNPDDELPSAYQKRPELAKNNSSSHHGLSVSPSFEKELPLVKGGGLNAQDNTSLSLLDPNLLPYFYHMYCVAPLAYAHLKPFLTPQGWAFPFIPPNIEAPSSPTQSTRVALDQKSECPHARSPLTIDTISTCTI